MLLEVNQNAIGNSLEFQFLTSITVLSVSMISPHLLLSTFGSGQFCLGTFVWYIVGDLEPFWAFTPLTTVATPPQ